MSMDNEDDDVFTILSHPVRRRILQTAFENSRISISEMKTWGHSIGSIYHHLKIINGFMDQDENRQYILTDEGHDLCRWFLRTDEGAVKVQEVESFGKTPNIIVDYLNRYTFPFLALFVLLTILSIGASNSSRIVVAGVMFYNSTSKPILTNSLLFLFHVGVYIGIQFLLTQKFRSLIKGAYPHTIAGFLLATLPVYIEVLVISVIGQPVPYPIWMILGIFNQVVFLVVITSLSIYVFNSDLKTSMLVAVGTMYVIQVINLFLF